MLKKKKFKPVIKRVRLNPEQAVLTCNCYSDGNNWTSFGFVFSDTGSSCDMNFYFGAGKPSDFGYMVGAASAS